jgi:regulator of replication initiation timing
MMYPNSMVSLLVYNQAVAEIERLKAEIIKLNNLANSNDEFKEEVEKLVKQNELLKQELKILREEIAGEELPKKPGRPRKTQSEK